MDVSVNLRQKVSSRDDWVQYMPRLPPNQLLRIH